MTATMNGDVGTIDEVEERLEGIAAPLRELLDMIDQERADLRARIAALDDKAKRVRRTIKALEPDAPKQPKPTRRSVTRPETVEQVLGLIQQAPDGLTRRELVELSDYSENPVMRAVERLREDGQVRLAGSRKTHPNARLSKVYKAAG